MRGSFTVAMLAGALALGGAGSARAGSVTIQYELTGGTAVSDFFEGSVTAGKYKLTLPASGANTVLSGPATLETLSVRAALSSSYQQLQQTVQLTLLAPLPGQGAPGSVFLGGAGKLSGYEILHCLASGSLCTYYGFTPSVPQLNPSFRVYPDAVGGVSIQGAAGTAQGSYLTGYGLYSGRVSFQFTGNEVSRTFVPEPLRRALLPTALLALALLRWAGRARQPGGARGQNGRLAWPAWVPRG